MNGVLGSVWRPVLGARPDWVNREEAEDACRPPLHVYSCGNAVTSGVDYTAAELQHAAILYNSLCQETHRGTAT